MNALKSPQRLKEVNIMKQVKRFGALFVVLALVVTLFASCGVPVEKAIIGSWRDSTGGFGLDLMEGGKARIVAGDFTIPILNIKLNNGQDATYVITKDDNDVNYLTVSFTFAVPVNLEFTFTLDDDILKLNYTKANLNYTLTRVDPAEETPAADAASDAQ